MGNINGRFSDQIPEILGAQLITARTNVKTDLNAILVESDQIRATNTFLVSQNIGNSNASGGIASAVALTAAGTVGAAQTSGEIGSGGQPCFFGTVRIETTHGWKHIRHIIIGDVVVTFDPATGELSQGKVVATFQHLVSKYCLLEFEDGGTTGVDAEGAHRYWDGADYQAVADLESVYHWDGKWKPRKIVDRRIVNEQVILYNFKVEGFHNYIANGDAVSNTKNPPELENPEFL